MRFSSKAVLADRPKRDGTRVVYLQSIINRLKATVNLGFTVLEQDFDNDRGVVKRSHPNAYMMNYQIAEAVARANKIFLDFKYSERFLTVESFKREFTDPAGTMDLVSFMEREIEVRRPKITPATHGHHVTTLKKLKGFQNRIFFHELTVDLLQRFENHLIQKYKLSQNTRHKVFKHIKIYVHEAERKDIRFRNPFNDYNVKSVDPTKPALDFDEIKRLFQYYQSSTIPANHRKVLQYFLFSCMSGIRISDISLIEWDHLHGNTLIFIPFKTRKTNRAVSIPLSDILLGLLPEKATSKRIFECYAKAVTNRLLKEIAKAEGVVIKKTLTYHVSRHTFATEFLDGGGHVETLQQILGHRMITTTMKYAKVKDKRKKEEMNLAFPVQTLLNE